MRVSRRSQAFAINSPACLALILITLKCSQTYEKLVLVPDGDGGSLNSIATTTFTGGTMRGRWRARGRFPPVPEYVTLCKSVGQKRRKTSVNEGSTGLQLTRGHERWVTKLSKLRERLRDRARDSGFNDPFPTPTELYRVW